MFSGRMWLPQLHRTRRATMPYQHFTSDERDALQVFIDKEFSVDLIARILGKHNSSVNREIARNSPNGFYLSRYAEIVSRNRRSSTEPCPKRDNKALMQVIEARINKDHSPEQITGRLRLEYPDSPAICHSLLKILIIKYQKCCKYCQYLQIICHLRITWL